MSIKLDHILLPTDFSELAKPAISYAVEFAKMFGSQVHCLHVVDDAYQYWSAVGPESLPLGPPPEEMLELGRTRMDRFRDEFLQELPKPAITHVGYGRPFAEIISYAKENEIDLIVMSTHGRGAIAHALLGSTTEKIVRKACCAVITVRADDETTCTS